MSVNWTVEQVMARINSQLEKNMLRAAEFGAGEAKKLLKVPAVEGNRRVRPGFKHAGMTYARPTKGNRAKPPPTPPRIITGHLMSSIKAVVARRANGSPIGAFGVERGVAEKYGYFLEMGGSGKGNKDRARPFLRRAIAENKARIFHLIIGGAK